MKRVVRHRILSVLAIVGGLLAWGAWTAADHGDSDNSGGVVLALFGILIIVLIYAAAGTEWMAGKIRRALTKDDA